MEQVHALERKLEFESIGVPTPKVNIAVGCLTRQSKWRKLWERICDYMKATPEPDYRAWRRMEYGSDDPDLRYRSYTNRFYYLR